MSQLPPKGKAEAISSSPAAAVVDDNETGEHMKAMWAGQSNVLVAVRTRPLMKHDQVKRSCVRVLDSKVVVIMDPASGDKLDILRANRSREKQYAFDFVFDAAARQDHVYNSTTKFLIHGVLDGFNATVFAYGQTGSGKTHTMIGSQADPGIMVRVMEDLFIHAQSQGKQQGVQYKVTVSFLEVYNENIRDLLSDVEEYLDLREDPMKGPVVASITEIEATSGSEVMQLLHQGNAKRSQAATAANEVSSRSHAVLQVVVESRDRAPGTVANIKVGKLSLVDLAGSERAANTKNVGARLVEGANINRSLLALGNCINALGEKGNKGNFVPYRDSKLTRLLKDSLGGNCRTVMIANISSAESSFEETLNTLKYANRAKNIKTNVQRNVLNVNYHISEYVELINNLRNEIQILKSQISNSPERVSSSMGNGIAAAGGGSGGEGGGLASSASHVHLSHHDVLPDLSDQLAAGLGPPQPALRILTPVTRLDGQGAAGLPMRSPALLRGANPSTPFQALRESLRSGAALVGENGRELVQQMRQKIVDNFQERMQLRRSLIELEDQNVQNSIEVSKRQLLVIQWSEKHGQMLKENDLDSFTKADFAAFILAHGSGEIIEAWQECEQLRKAIIKNNGMKKNIAKRLRHNEKEADHIREELGDKITGEDRRELMALQYQVGRLELENMELEQHRIVHESILKGKDLAIQKLRLQLAVRDKIISRQQAILNEHGLDSRVGYDQLAMLEETLMGDVDYGQQMPPSPPRDMANLLPQSKKPAALSRPANGASSSSSATATPRDGGGGGEVIATPVRFAQVKYSKHDVPSHHRGGGGDNKDGIAGVGGSPNKSKPSIPALNIQASPSGGAKAKNKKAARRKGRFMGSGADEEETEEEGEEDGALAMNLADDLEHDHDDDITTDAAANIKTISSNTQHTHLTNVTTSTHTNNSPHGHTSQNLSNSDSGEEIDDDYNMMPFTEREVALTSRDRDIIEEGDWAEIQSELSDNDFSFSDPPLGPGGIPVNGAGGEKGGGARKYTRGSNPQAVKRKVHPRIREAATKAVASAVPLQPGVAAGVGAALIVQSSEVKVNKAQMKEIKGVHGPRGGRHYRSSVPADDAGFNKGPVQRQGGAKVVPYSGAEDSDNDPDYHFPVNRGKYRHYNSPRGNNNNANNNNYGYNNSANNNSSSSGNNGSNMPPLVQHIEVQQEVGILTGRRYHDASPRSENINTNSNAVLSAVGAGINNPLSGKGGGLPQRSNSYQPAKGDRPQPQEEEIVDLENSVGEREGAVGLVIKSKSLLTKPTMPSSSSQVPGTGASASSAAVAMAMPKYRPKEKGMDKEANYANNQVINNFVAPVSNNSSDASLITVEGLAAAVNPSRPSNRLKPGR